MMVSMASAGSVFLLTGCHILPPAPAPSVVFTGHRCRAVLSCTGDFSVKGVKGRSGGFSPKICPCIEKVLRPGVLLLFRVGYYPGGGGGVRDRCHLSVFWLFIFSIWNRQNTRSRIGVAVIPFQINKRTFGYGGSCQRPIVPGSDQPDTKRDGSRPVSVCLLRRYSKIYLWCQRVLYARFVVYGS